MLFARVISSKVVTFCFLGDVTLICELVDGEFSMANVDSRSSMSKENSPGISPHTVVGNVGVLSLFQKKGLRRLFDFGTFGAGVLHAVGGGGGGGGPPFIGGGGGGGVMCRARGGTGGRGGRDHRRGSRGTGGMPDPQAGLYRA